MSEGNAGGGEGGYEGLVLPPSSQPLLWGEPSLPFLPTNGPSLTDGEAWGGLGRSQT